MVTHVMPPSVAPDEETGLIYAAIARELGKQIDKVSEDDYGKIERLSLEGAEIKIEGLSDMVDYQKGSVVSKTLIKKSSGTLTVFAFDEGQGLSEHTAPFDAPVYIIDGEAEITISGKPYNVKQGEMIILPVNKSHSLKAVKRFKMLLIMIQSQQ